MRVSLVPIVVAGLLIAGTTCTADPPKDQALLEGTWVMTSREFMGKKASEDEIKKLNTKIVFKGNTITVRSMDAGQEEVVSELTFMLDPATSPKSIDFTFTSGPSKGQTGSAIYEVDAESLKVCYALGEAKRPTKFAGSVDTEWVLLVYKREKK